METNAAIENFIKKYRLAISSKAKDIRITTEEAGDLVASIALMKSSNEALKELQRVVTQMHTDLAEKISNSGGSSGSIDGGGFKN